MMSYNKGWTQPKDFDNKILRLIRGIRKGLKGKIPISGHKNPISIVNDKPLWGKKAPKNEMKKEYFKNNK